MEKMKVTPEMITACKISCRVWLQKKIGWRIDGEKNSLVDDVMDYVFASIIPSIPKPKSRDTVKYIPVWEAPSKPSLETMLSELPIEGYDITTPDIYHNNQWTVSTEHDYFEGSTLTEAVTKYYNFLKKKK